MSWLPANHLLDLRDIGSPALHIFKTHRVSLGIGNKLDHRSRMDAPDNLFRQLLYGDFPDSTDVEVITDG